MQLIELMAVLASGAFGALLARRKQMDFVGVFCVAFICAFGGGTLRDVMLDRHPLFWIQYEHYPVLIFFLALATSFLRRLPRALEVWLHIPDALGIGLFTIVGAAYALDAGASLFVASLLGVVTGTFGGVLGDIVCNEVPSLFQSKAPLCATCAFVGAWVFMGLRAMPLAESVAVGAGIFVVVSLRLIALRYNIRLPTRRHDTAEQ